MFWVCGFRDFAEAAVEAKALPGHLSRGSSCGCGTKER